MIGTRWGRIVSIVAGRSDQIAARRIMRRRKFLHGQQSLAIERRPPDHRNVVAPGLIESSATRQSFKPEQVDAMVPMKRAGTPEEVAALVSFLVSEQAGYITGQVIGINGGMA